MPGEQVRLRYEPRLDGLRAIAVTLVIVSHTFDLPGAGPVGVGMFFVLSGFLITSILDQERESTGGLQFRHFYIRRALRLYPALVVFVAVYIVGLFLDVWQSSIGKGLATAAMALTYTTDSFTLVADGRWPSSELLHTWSLAVEEQFYVLWPIAFFVLMTRTTSWRTRWTVLGAGIVVGITVRAVASTQAAVALTPLTWTDALLIGCCLALAYRNGWIKPTHIHAATLAFVAIPAFLICRNGLTRFDQVIGLTLFDLGVAIWIINCLATPKRFDILGHPVMVRLGKLSYGIYLWHRLVQSALHDHLTADGWDYFLIVFAITVVIAELSYRVVEQPFLRRKDRYAVAT